MLNRSNSDGGAAPAPPPEDELVEAHEFVAHALRAGDARTVAAAYAHDAKLVAPSTGLVKGREEIEAFWQAGVDAGVSALQIEPLDVVCCDGLAYEVGRYSMHLTDDNGRAIVDRGKYVAVLEQQPDGGWHRAVEMFDPD